MSLQRFIIFNLLMLSLVATTAPAVGQEPCSEAGITGLSLNSPEFVGMETHECLAVRDDELEPLRGRGIEMRPDIYSGEQTNRGELEKDGLEKERLNDEELGHVKGRALGTEIPDLRNDTYSAIILWDEIKTKRIVSFDQGTGQVISTTSIQGR